MTTQSPTLGLRTSTRRRRLFATLSRTVPTSTRTRSNFRSLQIMGKHVYMQIVTNIQRTDCTFTAVLLIRVPIPTTDLPYYTGVKYGTVAILHRAIRIIRYGGDSIRPLRVLVRYHIIY